LRRFRIGATYDRRCDLVSADFLNIDFGNDALHLLDIRKDLDAKLLAQNFLGDSSGRHPAYGFAGAGAPATRPATYPKLRLVSIIRMRRAKFGRHFGISLRTRILVLDPQADRRA